ncbi:MAG TPA: MMPL family transporter [Dehalococcoidia bacterium]|nr:MMPL family transporter [Dehalococcoidia bacterium]
MFSPQNLATASARHPWRMVGLWLVGFIVSFVVIGSFLEDALTTDARVTNNPDSAVGEQLLEDRLRGEFRTNEAVIVQSADLTVDDAAFQAKVEAIQVQIRALGPEIIQDSTNFYETEAPAMVSQDRHAALITITMAGAIDDANTNVEEVIKIVQDADGADGFATFISGFATVNHDFTEAAERDLQRSEYGPLPLAFIILILVFGAVVAAIAPMVLAIMAIVLAIAIVALIGNTTDFSFFVVNMIVMMGLAVGIDYSLFILSRYREERNRGLDTDAAISVAGSTAGRAVLFSGLTVIIALLGLLIIPHTIFRSLASGAIFVVAASVLASLTLLPAILRLLGDRVNKGRIPLIQKAQQRFDEEHVGGFWDRVSRAVMARPVIGAVGATTLLAAAAIPFFDINLGGSGVSSLPDSFISKQGFDVLDAEFGGGQVNPVEVVIDAEGGDANSPQILAAVENLKAGVAGEPALNGATYETNGAGDLGLLSFQLKADPFSDEAVDTVGRLRKQYIPAAFAGVDNDVYVTGTAAISLDQYDLTDRYTPYVFAFVLGLSFILLMLVFRSIVVPATAIVMNLLSVGAAYGLIVLVFQKGFLGSTLGFQQVEAIESWLPLFLFAILFGLSMDYHVFLLSRIRERFDETGNNTEAVAFGIRSTGRLITGAALIMVAVFGGFAIGDLVMMQQMGFGLGVAVFLDATIIRSVLVPSTMKILGNANWYLPPVLHWLPRIGIEGSVVPAFEPESAAAGGGGS